MITNILNLNDIHVTMKSSVLPSIVEEVQNHKDKVENPVNPRRNGKIARLPKPARDMLNRMLDDGLPSHVIIEELGEAGEGLNAQNISNWVHGGYQDYLKHQEVIQRSKLQMEFAQELLREVPDLDPNLLVRISDTIAATQLIHALKEYGDEALKTFFLSTPSKYLKVVNALCRQSNSTVTREKHLLKQRVSSQIKPNQGPANTAAPSPATFPTLPGAVPTEVSGNSSQIKVNQAPTKNTLQSSPSPSKATEPRPSDQPGISSPIKLNQAPENNSSTATADAVIQQGSDSNQIKVNQGS